MGHLLKKNFSFKYIHLDQRCFTRASLISENIKHMLHHFSTKRENEKRDKITFRLSFPPYFICTLVIRRTGKYYLSIYFIYTIDMYFRPYKVSNFATYIFYYKSRKVVVFYSLLKFY